MFEMESITQLIIYIPYFIIAIFLAFYIPGWVLLKKLNLPVFQHFVLSTALGLVLWALQGFVFGFMQMRWMSYAYIIIFFLLWLKSFMRRKKKISLPFVSKKILDPFVLVTMIVGVAIHFSMLFLMGIRLKEGLYFCCGAIGDFLYQLRLTYEIIHQIPPYEPDMYGVLVHNYHYLGNIVVADLVKVFRLPLFYTQFQYMGVVVSFLLGLLAIVFSQINKLPKIVTRWLIFFLYFGGDLIFVIIFLLGRGINLSMGPLENGAAFLNNPPRAFAVVAFFAALCLFSLWIKKRDFYTGVLMALVLGSLIGFKVYIGIFALSGFFLLGCYYLVKRKIKQTIPLILALIISAVVYLPVNSNSGGLHYIGFWRFQEFIVQPALGLSHLELAQQIYFQHGSWLRVLQYNMLFLLLFNFSIFGTKLIGILQTKKTLSFLHKEIHIVLLCGIIVSFLAGSFFWQHSGGSNSFNFLVSVYIIGSIYTAIACFYWIKKLNKKAQIFLTIVIVLLNLPRITFEEYKNINLIARKGGHLISNENLQAMIFLKEHTDKSSIIFTGGPIYHTFISERSMYLGEYGLLTSHDIDTSKHQEVVKTILQYKDSFIVKKLLRENNISYLYLSSGERNISTQSAGMFESVFKNDNVHILKVF